jgi:hypothetical protein
MMRRAVSSSGASKIPIPVLTGPKVGLARIGDPSASRRPSHSAWAANAARSSSVMVAAKFSRGGCRK